MPKNDNDAIIRLARERHQDAKDSDKDERKAIEDDVRFAVDDRGCQWPSDVRTSREGDSPPRPCLVINKIPEKIDQVEGEFRQLAPSVKVRGVDSLADPKVAQIIGGIIRHIEYGSTARSAYNHAHSSNLYSGRGAWEVGIEDDEDDPFVRCITINRIPNVLTVCWDPGAQKEDKSDAGYFLITAEINEKEFKDQYPGVELSDWDAGDDTMEGWRTDETVRVAKYWWKEKIDKKFFRIRRNGANGMPVTVTVSEETFNKMPRNDEMKILKEKTVKTDKVRWGIMIHDKFIEGPYDDWPSKYIPIVIESGKEVNIKGEFKTRGMTRFAKGPQMMYNYWSTSTTEAIAIAPKAPYLVTPGQIGKYQPQWDLAASKNFMYLFYDVDPKAPNLTPKREAPPQLSTAYANELARMEHDIMSSMGIYQASLGDQGQEKSGRAIIARQRQGSIGSYTYTDKFKSALEYSTKVVMDLIPYVFDTERIVRITGEDGKEKSVPINAVPGGQAMTEVGEISEDLVSQKPEISEYINDLSVGKYDVVVTVGPSYTTQRQEVVAMLLDLIQSVPKIGMAIADILIKNLDIPGADEIVERVKKLVPQGIRKLEPGEQPEPPDPEVTIKMQEMMLKMQQENRKEFESVVKAIKDLAEAESKERGSQIGEFTAIANQIREMVGQKPQQGQPSGMQG